MALEHRTAELHDAEHDLVAYRDLYLLTLGLLAETESKLRQARERHDRLVDENRFLRASLRRPVAA